MATECGTATALLLYCRAGGRGRFHGTRGGVKGYGCVHGYWGMVRAWPFGGAEGKIEWSKTGNPRLKKYADESKLKGKKMQDIWTSYKDPSRPTYPTEKNYDMLKMIVEQSSNRGSWVLDAFGGSGTTGKAAAELGRKFILIDQSDIAIKLEREFFESDLLESTDFVDLS